MASAPRAARGFSPLDDELALAPCGLAPGLHEGLVRLATWIPSFAHAARELSYFTGATVPETTARRLTQDAGAAYSQVQHAQVARIRAVLPAPPPGPPVQQLSVDGALVPLVGGEWAEVKTLVVGALAGREPGECVRAEELSDFSRLADAAHFTAAALVETHRRGPETADAVVAVMDGAAWEQGFVDAHRADAVRVLDFCHAAGYLAAAAQAVYGPGTRACGAWVERHSGTSSGTASPRRCWRHCARSTSAPAARHRRWSGRVWSSCTAGASRSGTPSGSSWACPSAAGPWRAPTSCWWRSG